jgi:hypothetical protein
MGAVSAMLMLVERVEHHDPPTVFLGWLDAA